MTAYPATALLPLQRFEVLRLEELGSGPHVVLESCSALNDGESLLVGATVTSQLLTRGLHRPASARGLPFRMDVGGSGTFVLMDGFRRRCLMQLRSGESVLLADRSGRVRTVVVGRIRQERQPLVRIHARAPSGQTAEAVVRPADDVYLLGDNDECLSTAQLTPGAPVLGHLPGAGWLDCRQRALKRTLSPLPDDAMPL